MLGHCTKSLPLVFHFILFHALPNSRIPYGRYESHPPLTNPHFKASFNSRKKTLDSGTARCLADLLSVKSFLLAVQLLLLSVRSFLLDFQPLLYSLPSLSCSLFSCYCTLNRALLLASTFCGLSSLASAPYSAFPACCPCSYEPV